MSSFDTSESYLMTSESVTEGHPDKLCDQISDAILDAMLKQDEYSRVACEVAVTTGLVLVTGEITTTAYVDIPSVVRGVIKRVGYTNCEHGFDADSCGIIVSVKEQSPDISQAVGDSVGAGDQGMMFGYACRDTKELMPLPITLAHALTKQLAQVRKNQTKMLLFPDGKSQVTIEYDKGLPKRIHTIVVSTQHAQGIERLLPQYVYDLVISPVLAEKGLWNRQTTQYEAFSNLLDDDTVILVNPSGRFVVGGPQGDAGVTGRKIIVDTYGSAARHGGGAFSGKDPTKVDRTGAYAARYVAKNLVAAGICERAEVQLSYAIGKADPTSVSVETFGTAVLTPEEINELVAQHFDLRPNSLIIQFGLRQPIYEALASYGHFSNYDMPWEQTDLEVPLDEAKRSIIYEELNA